MNDTTVAMRPLAVRACVACGRSFPPKKGVHVYCSKVCQERMHTLRKRVTQVPSLPKPCTECLENFQPVRASHDFCSRACSITARRKVAHEARAAVPVECTTCSATFLPRKTWQVYCSTRCRNTATAKRATSRRVVKLCRTCNEYQSRSKFEDGAWNCNECVSVKSAGLRRCSSCEEVKVISEFNWHHAGGAQSRCRPCSKEAERIRTQDPVERRRARSARLLRSFGITADEFDELLMIQGGVCAICREAREGDGDAFHVDHDHRCCAGQRTCGACIRGICCRGCNQAMGLLKDSAERADAIAAYLRRDRAGRQVTAGDGQAMRSRAD